MILRSLQATIEEKNTVVKVTSLPPKGIAQNQRMCMQKDDIFQKFHNSSSHQYR
ncbi:17528_t:CDS:2 [Funneliformis caledonium]|uniref:17528_t:CDS:1 n=1 Tax=Funneliformis caledonium TaxID=1117310 RepID=A0A9N9BKG3_9GLOM|nr:17528_t:CDS:2 [Funneliformis caledonium]